MRRPIATFALLCSLFLGLAAAPAAAAGPYPGTTEWPGNPPSTRWIPATATSPRGTPDSQFPPGDEAFHTYAEMRDEVQAVAAAHSSIVRWFDLPMETENGLKLMVAKISDNVDLDEDEPEVFFNGLTHAREHITVEQTLAILHWLADDYGSVSRVTDIVDSREVWIVFNVNPDGGEYDIKDGVYHNWRKNRQPTPGSPYTGTDINRNYGYRWGCCGGSSSNPAAITYRGPSAWSTQEATAMRDFVLSRRVDGRQQIRTAMSFHSYGKQILYPFGYTTQDVPVDMTQHDWQALTHMAQGMGSRNGYQPIQESFNYITSGAFIDWSYGDQRIPTFTFELYPRTSAEGGFYPPAAQALAAVQDNRDAILWFLEQSDCPWRVAGPTYEQLDCGPFFDDLEVGRGWTVDPLGTDTATTGAWERGDAAGTNANGPKQLASAASGTGVLATGLEAGIAPKANDLDGRTTVESPAIDIPTGAQLSFQYTWAHGARSTSADLLRVRVVHATGDRIVWLRLGQPVNRDATWKTATVDLSEFAGETVRIRFEAKDGASDNMVEAAIDEVRVTVP